MIPYDAAANTVAARFTAGEPDSIAEIYREYGRLVYAVAYRVLGDAGLAEDATQQTFVKAWQHMKSFDPSREFAPWLATIASRTAIDVQRSNRHHRDQRSLDTMLATEQAPSTPPPSAEHIYDVWQLRRALDSLPDQERELVRLQHYQQLTHQEIADLLAIPLGTVKSRSYRAHRSLAGLLGHLRAEPASDGVGDADNHRCRAGRHRQRLVTVMAV